MATHSSVLAWRIPGMGEPGGLLSVGSHSRTRLKRFSSSSSSLFFLLLPVSSVSYPRNHCQIQCHEAFPLFSSKNIIVLGFMCRSLIHFELIFVFGVSKGLTFVHVGNNFPNTIFWKGCLPQLMILILLSKIVWPYTQGFLSLWILSFFFFFSLSLYFGCTASMRDPNFLTRDGICIHCIGSVGA